MTPKNAKLVEDMGQQLYMVGLFAAQFGNDAKRAQAHGFIHGALSAIEMLKGASFRKAVQAHLPDNWEKELGAKTTTKHKERVTS